MKARRLYQRPVGANTDSSQPGSEPTAPMGLWPPTLRNIQRNSEKRADRNSHFAPLDQHRPVQSPARSLQGPCPAGGHPQLQLPSALRVLSWGHRAAPGSCSPPPLPSADSSAPIPYVSPHPDALQHPDPVALVPAEGDAPAARPAAAAPHAKGRPPGTPLRAQRQHSLSAACQHARLPLVDGFRVANGAARCWRSGAVQAGGCSLAASRRAGGVFPLSFTARCAPLSAVFHAFLLGVARGW